jgi:hypothetical protein
MTIRRNNNRLASPVLPDRNGLQGVDGNDVPILIGKSR